MKIPVMKKAKSNTARRGVVLILTLVILVILSIVGYTLTSRVSSHRHRCQYIIDNQAARYACDTGTKYALATLNAIKPNFADRVNEPDFSDIFALTEDEYEQLLDEWNEQIELEKAQGFRIDKTAGEQDPKLMAIFSNFGDRTSPGDTNDMNSYGPANQNAQYLPDDFNEPNETKIPGPYGPPWPLVIKTRNFKVGPATVKIKIEDENAKYPIGWVLVRNEEIQWELEAGFQTFCEWMNINQEEYLGLQSDFDKIAQLKEFKFKFRPISRPKRITTERVIVRGDKKIRVPRTTTVKQTLSESVHLQDFAKLLHSSLIDTDILSRPTIESDERKESALKYIGMWGSDKVNINTAPRHVLEAAFTFGGDAALIADAIIRERRIKPFKDLEELSKKLLQYSEAIKKCKKYITTESNFFTIKVTAIKGTAQASRVIALKKEKNGFKKLAAISS